MSDLSAFFLPLIQSPEFREVLKSTFLQALEEKNPTIPAPVFYTQTETSGILHCSIPSLIDYRRRGWIKGRKVGNRVLFTTEDINEAVKTIAEAKYKKV